MKDKEIEYWIVRRERFELVKTLVSENKLEEIMDMFPGEWNICDKRLDRIDVEENSVTFVDRGIQTPIETIDGSWGIKIWSSPND